MLVEGSKYMIEFKRKGQRMFVLEIWFKPISKSVFFFDHEFQTLNIFKMDKLAEIFILYFMISSF